MHEIINVQQLFGQFSEMSHHFAEVDFFILLRATIYFLIGMVITLMARWFVGKITEKNVSPHHSMLFRKITFYIGLAFSIILPLKASGIDVNAILGAAGIITIAIAFAAQTSISNFLSGVFLEAEKPFVIGDFVQVKDTLGEVLSIDLLSVKIRTKDNTLVRIPNQILLNSQFRNVSRFPIRRFDIKFRVYFDEDITKINEICHGVAKRNPLCMIKPEPELSIQEFSESGINVMFSIWAKQSSYNQLQTEIQNEIQAAFRQNNVQLPATNLAPQSA